MQFSMQVLGLYYIPNIFVGKWRERKEKSRTSEKDGEPKTEKERKIYLKEDEAEGCRPDLNQTSGM